MHNWCIKSLISVHVSFRGPAVEGQWTGLKDKHISGYVHGVMSFETVALTDYYKPTICVVT